MCNFRAIAIAVVIPLLLAACQTTPDEGAAVEDRKGGVSTSPVGSGGVSGSDLTNPASLKDPNSILSKRSVFFDFDKFDIKPEFRTLVEAHATFLRANQNARMLIQGNTDERGSREYNLALGQKRADAIKRNLLLLGAKEAQIESVSLGEEKPRATGQSEEAYAQNRRGDMLYQGEY